MLIGRRLAVPVLTGAFVPPLAHGKLPTETHTLPQGTQAQETQHPSFTPESETATRAATAELSLARSPTSTPACQGQNGYGPEDQPLILLQTPPFSPLTHHHHLQLHPPNNSSYTSSTPSLSSTTLFNVASLLLHALYSFVSDKSLCARFLRRTPAHPTTTVHSGPNKRRRHCQANSLAVPRFEGFETFSPFHNTGRIYTFTTSCRQPFVIMVSFSLVAALVAASTLVDATAYQQTTLMGCYSSSQGMIFNDTAIYQSSGHCQQQCVPANYAVMATTGGSDCWCGDTMPPLNAKVDASNCDTNCTGYGLEFCGSSDGKYFSVWNDGMKATILNNGVSTPGSSSSTTSASPSVVTVGGQTHTITAASTPKPSSGSAGPNKAAIAAGVIVGILAVAGICGGIYFFMRRKQLEVEDEKKRQHAISNFMQAKRTGSSGGISSTDSRLDPIIMTRRQSDGSIADNQDYSRRILKVTNA